MFRDAHHYFSLVSKNVEAYTEIASELGDGEFLTDPELYNQLAAILKKEYGECFLKTSAVSKNWISPSDCGASSAPPTDKSAVSLLLANTKSIHFSH